ncbi:MAG: hypothetical protein JNL32_13820, partial [Candidatus Kapabacteria bacterium]|nr:hypothetical protein [Candidatus Kapabacteria bacterium]
MKRSLIIVLLLLLASSVAWASVVRLEKRTSKTGMVMSSKVVEKKSVEKTVVAKTAKSATVMSAERVAAAKERVERMERLAAERAVNKESRREMNARAEREAKERGRALRTESTPMNMNDAEAAEQDAVVDFSYGGVVNASISARFVDNDFLLPVTELFSLLRINQTVDPRTRRIIGRFGLKQVPYVIDVDKKIINLDGVTYDLNENDFFNAAGEIFFSAKVYERVFAWKLSSNLRSLSIVLQTDEDLPILADRRREQSWQQLSRMGLIGTQMGANSYYPLIDGAGISRPLIDGGGIGYNLSTSISGQRMMSNAIGLNGGFRLLGGDATLNTSGSYLVNDNRMLLLTNWQWRFALEENNWLQSVTAGVLPTQGVTPMQIQGARLTNEPLQPRIFFDFAEINGELDKSVWRAVELLRGMETLDYQKLDSTGKYSFSVPRFQGVTLYTLRKYGVTGEVEDETFTYNIPATMWQPGRVVYNMTGGRDQQTGLWSGNGTMSVGVFDWLTNTTGVDYQYQSSFFPRPLVFNSTHMRILRSTALSVDVVADAVIRATSQTFFSNASMLDASYARFLPNSIFSNSIRGFSNGAGAGVIDRSSLAMNIVQPLGISGVSTRVSGIMDRAESGNSYQYTTDLFTNWSSLLLMTSYRGTYRRQSAGGELNHFLNGSVMYSIQSSSPVISGTMMNAAYSVDLTTRKLQSVSLNISRPIVQGAMINMSVNYSPIAKTYAGAINLMWNLGSVQAAAGTNFSPNMSPTTTMSLQGAMSMNPQTGDINFAAMNWIGTGSAAFRPFIDENGNGKYDEGERIIEARINPAFGGMQQQNGQFQSVIGMPSYSRVNAAIDEESLPNPMFKPKFAKFSFYAEPNTFKAVDVPFIVAGSIEGITRKLIAGTVVNNGVSGLRMRISGITDTTYRKTIMTFTD